MNFDIKNKNNADSILIRGDRMIMHLNLENAVNLDDLSKEFTSEMFDLMRLEKLQKQEENEDDF